MTEVIVNCPDCGYAHSEDTDKAPYYIHCKGCGVKIFIFSNGYQKAKPRGKTIKPFELTISRKDYEKIVDELLSEGWRIKKFIGKFPDGSVVLVTEPEEPGDDIPGILQHQTQREFDDSVRGRGLRK